MEVRGWRVRVYFLRIAMAALVDAFVVGDAAAVIDGLEFDGLTGSGLGDISNYLFVV